MILDYAMGKVIRVAVFLGIFSFVVFLIVFVLSQKQIISPVPEEGAIRIIYISPSPTGAVTPSIISKP
jgi:hypothetical protein